MWLLGAPCLEVGMQGLLCDPPRSRAQITPRLTSQYSTSTWRRQACFSALSRVVFAGVLDRINGLRDPPAEAACA